MNELENIKEQLMEALFALQAVADWDEDGDEAYGDVTSYARIKLDKIAEIQKKLEVSESTEKPSADPYLQTR